MNDTITVMCPLCGEKLEKPVPDFNRNPSSLEEALGVSSGFFNNQVALQLSEEFEAKLSHHFGEEHKLEEWVKKVIDQKQVIKQLEQSLDLQ